MSSIRNTFRSGVMNFGRSSIRDHRSYTWPTGAFTTTDCRAAFISAGSIVCVELSGREASIKVPRKNPAPTVSEVKERHVQQEHGVVSARAFSKHLAKAASRSALV